MKILLVNPPRSPHNSILEYAPEEAKRFIHRKLVGPPLGLLTAAAAVADHDVSFLDTKGEYDLVPDAPGLEELLEEHLAKFGPDIVGVTVIASEFDAGIRILRTAKKYNPDILTVAGGLHVTLCPQDFAVDGVDVLCPGQSAHTFRELADAQEAGRPLSDVPGVLINEGGNLVASVGVPRAIDAAGRDFILPDRTLIRRWLNTYRVPKAPGPVTYLFSSLGCPYRCTFCSIWPQFGGTYYKRSVEGLIEELKGLDEYPVVRFADANTVVDIDFIRALFRRIGEEGIRKEYVMDIRPDTAARYPDVIELMAKHGLKVVISGFESFRNEDLKKFNKSSDAELIQDSVNVFHQNDIMVRGNYVIPPDFTKDDFAAMSAFADAHRVSYAGYTILTPMPGTVYYKEIESAIVDRDLSKYNFFNSVLRTKLPHDEFCEQVGRLWLIKKGEDVI